MKILVVYQYFLDKDESGLSRFNKMLEYWEEKGHKITVVAGDVNYTKGNKKEQYKGKLFTKQQYSKNITLYRTYVSESYNKSILGRLWGYFSFTISSSLVSLLKVKKHDVVIVSSPPLFVGITGILLKFFKRMPLVFEVRDIWPESAIDLGLLNNKLLIKLSFLGEKLFYKYADKINVLTPAFKDFLIERKGISEQKIMYVPNGADLDVFYPQQKSSKLEALKKPFEGKFLVSYFGSHSTANKLEQLLEVAKACLQDKEIHFLFIGDGKEKANLLRKAKEDGLNNVTFLDQKPREIINDYCAISDVGVAILPKINIFKTVYPSKMFDYLAAGKPVILGVDGVARELIENHECGIYVNPEDVIEFREVIIKIKNDKNLMNLMSVNGVRLMKNKFDRKNLAVQYLEELKF